MAIRLWVAGVGANEVSETPAWILPKTDLWPPVFHAVPGFRSYLAPTPATLPFPVQSDRDHKRAIQSRSSISHFSPQPDRVCTLGLHSNRDFCCFFGKQLDLNDPVDWLFGRRWYFIFWMLHRDMFFVSQ